jgi:hypothetical protein
LPLDHDAHGIIDRCYMVGIEGMAQSEHIGEESKSYQRWKSPDVVAIQGAAHHMQQRDTAVQCGDLQPVGRL